MNNETEQIQCSTFQQIEMKSYQIVTKIENQMIWNLLGVSTKKKK